MKTTYVLITAMDGYNSMGVMTNDRGYKEYIRLFEDPDIEIFINDANLTQDEVVERLEGYIANEAKEKGLNDYFQFDEGKAVLISDLDAEGQTITEIYTDCSGADVKKIRAISGLSQKAFGKKYGIPARTIENWESGEREMPDYVLDLLEKAVWEDKDNTYLTWAVIYKRDDEFITPCASKADALEVGQDEYDRLTSQEKKNADYLYVGLCNLDEHGDWRELEDGTIDADVREVAKEWI